MNRKSFERNSVRFVGTLLALVGVLTIWHLGKDPLVPSAEAARPPSVDSSLDVAQAAPGSFADVVEAVMPAVVNISVAGGAVAPDSSPFRGAPDVPFGDLEDFLRRFFERQALPLPDPDPRQAPEGPVFRGMGSGFLVDAKGYVVTNHHVVGNASEITVTLHDGSSLPATLVGSDPKTDLAVVKVETETDRELPYARFGDSETIRAGDWVLAIGNPFGLGSSATAGIVSARGRDLQSGPFDDFIQIDAPINQGNSGGPLFDRTGRVVGVNTAIYSPNGGNVGIGFAIPASLAGPIIEELKTKGHVERGWLGVEIQAIDDDLADALGLEKAEGALVANVVHESPADDAGLVAGDVIVGVNGESTPRLKDVTRAIAEVEPNDAARIDLVRDGKKISVDVEIGRSPDSPEAVRARADANGKVDDDSGPRLGLALADLTADIKRQLGIDGEVEGAVVARVERDSPAARQGLRRGDVIIAVGRNGVTDAESAIRAIDELEKEGRPSVLLRVQRGSTASFVAVPFA